MTAKEYINQDIKDWGYKPKLKDKILGGEGFLIYHYVRHLRGYEYYSERGGVIASFLRYYHKFFYLKMGNQMRVCIAPFTIGQGFRFYHLGDFIHIGHGCKIGKHFTCNNGVLLGGGCKITIGNNVTLNPGVKIIKDVKIGNNVTVGTMAVVTHDIPDNAVAAGIPARVLYYKERDC